MAFRLVLFDLDGTLLDPERRILDATLEATAGLMAAGVQVGFATGRSPRSVAPYAAQLRPNGPSILFNGGAVWDLAAGRAVAGATLPRPATLAALGLAAELGLHVNLYVGDRLYIERVTEVSQHSEIKDGVPHEVVGPLAAFFADAGQPAHKLLMIEPRGDFAAFEARYAAHAEGCTLVHSEPTYLEVLPPGISKGAGLATIERACGIAAAEVIAFGDGLNDVELLMAAGLGVAMGNAEPGLKRVADRVIGKNDEASIARFLRQELELVRGSLRLRAAVDG